MPIHRQRNVANMKTSDPLDRRKFLRLSSAGIGAFGLAAAPAFGQSSKANAAFAQVLAGAQREGRVVWAGAVPQSATVQKISDAFNAKFGTSIQVENLPVPARDLPTRFITESRGNTASVDAGWGPVSSLLQLDQIGLFQPYRWLDTFGSKLPQIKTSYDRMNEYFPGGKALDFLHVVYCLTYNTKSIRRDQLPTSWNALADPKWHGQFAFSVLASPFAQLANRTGETAALATVGRIKANAPRLGRGSPEIVELVITGEVPFGVADISSTEARKRAGAPVDWALLDVIPFFRTGMYTTKFAPHPNAAHLFMAYMAHDGLLIMQREEGWGQIWPGSGFELARAVAAHKAPLASARTPYEVQREADFGNKLAQFMSQ